MIHTIPLNHRFIASKVPSKKLLAQMNPELKHANWLCTHGTRDDVLPYETSRTQVEALQKGGFDITFKSYPKVHTIAEDELGMIKEWIQSNSNNRP